MAVSVQAVNPVSECKNPLHINFYIGSCREIQYHLLDRHLISSPTDDTKFEKFALVLSIFGKEEEELLTWNVVQHPGYEQARQSSRFKALNVLACHSVSKEIHNFHSPRSTCKITVSRLKLDFSSNLGSLQKFNHQHIQQAPSQGAE